MNKKFLLATFCGAIAVFTSCTNKLDNSVNFIPSKASSVAQINIKQIKEKNTNLSGVFDYLAGETDENIKKIYESGIDLDKSIFAYVGKIDDETPYYGALFSISNEDQFKNTLQKELKTPFTTSGEFTIVTLPEKKGIITWKENTGIWINIPEEGLAIELLTSNDETNTLINTNDNFKKSIQNNNDLTLWVNLDETKAIAHHLDPKIAAVQDEMELSKSFLTSNINFNNGEIILDNTFTGSEENLSKYETIYNGDLSNSLLESASGENLVLAYLLNLNLDEVFNLLETENGINSEAVDFLARFNVTPEALKEALSGEAIVTVNGLEGFIPFNYKASIVLGLKNEDKTNEILENLTSYGISYDESEGFYRNAFFLAKVEDKKLIIAGPNFDFAKALLKGEGKKLKEIGLDNANGEMLINVDAIPVSLLKMVSTQYPIINELKSLSTSTVMKEDNVSYKIIIKLKKEDQNSLSVLSGYTKELM